MPLSAKEMIRLLEAAGWRFARQKGSHRMYTHPTRPGIVVIPMHKGDLKIGTERDIRKVAGL
jgi:predicted RNA binding protein YcfA (HicA-like mRNA interferase family)